MASIGKSPFCIAEFWKVPKALISTFPGSKVKIITHIAIKKRMSKTNIYALFCRRYFCLLNPVIIPDSEITLTVAVESTT